MIDESIHGQEEVYLDELIRLGAHEPCRSPALFRLFHE